MTASLHSYSAARDFSKRCLDTRRRDSLAGERWLLTASLLAAMLEARRTGGKSREEDRPQFSAWQGRVSQQPSAAAAAGASSSTSKGSSKGAERPSSTAKWPKWTTDQYLDFEHKRLVRAAAPAADATDVEKANTAFRQSTFRVRPAHHPERFLNFVNGRPVVGFGEKSI